MDLWVHILVKLQDNNEKNPWQLHRFDLTLITYQDLTLWPMICDLWVLHEVWLVVYQKRRQVDYYMVNYWKIHGLINSGKTMQNLRNLPPVNKGKGKQHNWDCAYCQKTIGWWFWHINRWCHWLHLTLI